MNLLMRAMVGLRRWATPDVGFIAVLIGSLAGIEVLGRQSQSDLHDVGALMLLSLLTVLTATRHRRTPMAWVTALHGPLDWVIERTRGWTFQMGLDMRGEPAVKRGVPPIITRTALLLSIAVVIFAGIAKWLPLSVRTGLIAVSYLLYLAALMVLWAHLAIAILLAAFVPVAIIHDSFIARHRGLGRRSRRPELLAIGGYFGFLFVLGAQCPFWVAPTASLVFTVIYLIGVMPSRRFAVQLLWRPRGSIRVRSMSWGQWVTWEFVLIGLFMQALTLASCGSLVVGDELTTASTVMPITSLLGVTLAWLGPGVLGVLCFQMLMGRWRDPARPARPSAHVRMAAADVSQAEVRQAFAQRGWQVRFDSQPPQPLDVRVVIAAAALPDDAGRQQWPLVITPPDLDRPGLWVRLLRRAEIQHRRQFLTGLESLLKVAKSKARGGMGFWLSPHFWFISGLMRDTRPGEEGDFDLIDDPILTAAIGTPYHRAFPRAVRHHLYNVLRGTRVDLIFVEDGLSFKRLRRALRVLFEVYDVHGGRRAAEEVDFRGLPGTRVVIHDFQFDEPYQSRTYPEPKYEFLGRARILHIFKDRGGEEELLDAPMDWDRQPAPLGMV
jgi:ABC-type Co2+ transport system permease subunit